MANICDSLLQKDIAADCSAPIVRGMEPDGVIINRCDLDFTQTVFDSTCKNILQKMILKTGKKGYAVVQMGATPYTGAKTSMEAGTYHNTFTNEIPIAILNNGPEVSEKIIDGLANGTYVLVLKNKHKGADGKAEYQVYGYYQGLTPSAIENEKYSEDTDGGWLVTLQEKSVPKSALFFFNDSSTVTATQFEALKTEAE